MSIKAISFMSAPAKNQQAVAKAPAASVPNTPAVPEKKKGKGGKILALCVVAAGIAGIAYAAKKGKLGKLTKASAQKASNLKEGVMGESYIKKLIGIADNARTNKQIADVAERTSEAGVNKWLQHFGEGAEHVVQDLNKFVVA